MTAYAYVDHARLVADLKAGDGAAVAYAYRQLFGSQLGRLVLTHQLAEAGVGAIRGPNLPRDESRYHDGRADHALHFLNLAGFDRLSAAHAVAADTLEGQDHDGHHTDGRDGGFSGPDVDGTVVDDDDHGLDGRGQGPD